ncbi:MULTISPECIES: hypothetical protein [unclassified Curtobacterium]|uniref:hypothetical protein n=1 Tax=unclassified Curtobacterium TaxID=257496 RepID=UPI0011B48A91|nr:MULTISPECIES: hypothetical protein [unclassified Curtobacterium]
MKGLSLSDDDTARGLIDSGEGLVSNWWRDSGSIAPSDVRGQLTLTALDRHINHFDDPDPATGRPFREITPFISLSAGTVERQSTAATNFAHRARKTALWFGSQFGAKSSAYLFVCWLVLAPRPAVEVESVAEEVRDLNSYRRYSAFQTEGEIVAKINVPVTQIHSCEKWNWDRSNNVLWREWIHPNGSFIAPDSLSNLREMI